MFELCNEGIHTRNEDSPKINIYEYLQVDTNEKYYLWVDGNSSICCNSAHTTTGFHGRFAEVDFHNEWAGTMSIPSFG